MYETVNPPPGQKKSILGGSIIPKEDQGNGVPGPATYFTADNENDGRFSHISGYKIMKPSIQPKEAENSKETPVGPWKYNPNNPTFVSTKWGFGTGK